MILMAKTTKFDAADYLDSPQAIAGYLSEAFETGDEQYIAQAIGTVARVEGMSKIATDTGLSRESLYRALGEGGNPEFGTVMKVLNALDVQLVAKKVRGRFLGQSLGSPLVRE
jgi:probable addiction module antidote protein